MCKREVAFRNVGDKLTSRGLCSIEKIVIAFVGRCLSGKFLVGTNCTGFYGFMIEVSSVRRWTVLIESRGEGLEFIFVPQISSNNCSKVPKLLVSIYY